MLFNSFEFIVFFPLVTLIYFMIPHKYRWAHLLFVSCIFYMAFIPAYILILAFTIVIDYVAGILIENSTGKRRKYFLIMSIVANVAVLCVFKYYNFFIDNVNDLLASLNIHTKPLPYLAIILPIGLSFHTFQAMSYTIEVYRGNQKAERHFGIYALYVMYYPQLVAGPIERPQHILHQLKEPQKFEYDRVVDGLKQMAWGMFKKVVIADNLAGIVNMYYSSPESFNGFSAFLAVIFFSFQIYCDFSGYSDIAIGASKVMGINLMKNFNQPYLANSISNFWKRWHISLSSWFRDYLYIPLGGNKVPVPRMYLNLMIVFVISGFWHGANWTFILWGALHGFYLIIGLMISGRSKNQKLPEKKPAALPYLGTILLTFLLVTFSWIFFRANSVSEAGYIIKQLSTTTFSFSQIKETLLQLNISIPFFITISLLICLLIFSDWLQERAGIIQFVNRRSVAIRWSVYFAVVGMIMFFGVWGNQQFIYFQF